MKHDYKITFFSSLGRPCVHFVDDATIEEARAYAQRKWYLAPRCLIQEVA